MKVVLFGTALLGASLAVWLAYDEWKAARRRARLQRSETRARQELFRYQFVHDPSARSGERLIPS